MPLTREAVETVLVRRCGRLMAWANLDGEGHAGSNADLADPIASALRACDVELIDPTEPADDDFLGLAAADHGKFLDVAELRCLESVWGNLDEVTEQEGTDRQEWTRARQEIAARIESKRKQIAEEHGLGMGSLSAGSMTLLWAEQPADESGEWA